MSANEPIRVQLNPTVAVDDNLRQRIAEAILSGLSREDAISQLIQMGVPREVANDEVSKAFASPYFKPAMRQADRARKRTWVLDSMAKLHRMNPDARQITEIAAQDLTPQQFFKNHYCANRPLMIRGIAKDWPALSLWSLDYFEQKLGDKDVEVQANRNTSRDYEMYKDKFTQRMPFSQFISLLRNTESGNDVYLTAYNTGLNGESLAPLWEDVGTLEPYLKPSRGGSFFWIGPKGTLTPFHHDLMNIFLMQVVGRKRVVMAPSFEIARMRNDRHCFSQWANDPKAAAQKGPNAPFLNEIIIEPGDALFLPVGWWHFVESLDLSFSLSFNNFSVDNEFSSFYSTNGPV